MENKMAYGYQEPKAVLKEEKNNGHDMQICFMEMIIKGSS
jgi:hypothetical protein